MIHHAMTWWAVTQSSPLTIKLCGWALAWAISMHFLYMYTCMSTTNRTIYPHLSGLLLDSVAAIALWFAFVWLQVKSWPHVCMVVLCLYDTPSLLGLQS